jgi:hypothetical protein
MNTPFQNPADHPCAALPIQHHSRPDPAVDRLVAVMNITQDRALIDEIYVCIFRATNEDSQ